MDEAGHVIAIGTSSYTPFINTNLVKSGEEPRTWRDLVEPRWKGKLVISDPSIAPGPATLYWALTSRGKLSRDYFVQLGRQELKLASTTRDLVASVARGEGAVALGVSEITAGPIVAEGAPLKAVDMAEGIPQEISAAMAMVKNAPHPNAARVFMNWFMSQEGQTTYVKLYPQLSIRKDVPDGRPAPLRISIKEPLPLTIQDTEAAARIMREKELYNIIVSGK